MVISTSLTLSDTSATSNYRGTFRKTAAVTDIFVLHLPVCKVPKSQHFYRESYQCPTYYSH